MIRWLLDQGYAVFVISWVNPGEELAQKGFSDYMKEGPIAALDVVEKITKSKKINVAGWCIGGALLGATAAYLKAKGDERINSLTFMTTLFEYSQAGELAAYLSDEMMSLIDENVARKGFLDGRILSLSFSMLRENNLFWNYFINNYLKGQDPVAFDILHWNSDPTNLPAVCFEEYMQATYRGNRLKNPGEFVLDGVPIDLSVIDAPCYFLATKADHIVLWQGAYESAKLFSAEKRFVLAGSGHLAGVINPAEGGKYPHWTNDQLVDDPEQWVSEAAEHKGSWWPDWDSWMAPMSGEKKKAVPPGRLKAYPVIENAPGSYVKVRL